MTQVCTKCTNFLTVCSVGVFENLQDLGSAGKHKGWLYHSDVSVYMSVFVEVKALHKFW